MDFVEIVGLGAAFLITAALYASVGQAGATGYLAVMGLAGLDPAMMKPTALALNVLVAAIGTFQFWRAGRFSWRTFYPFGVLGFPFSVIGGAINLPAHIYYPVVGVILLLAAVQLIRSTNSRSVTEEKPPHAPPFLPCLLTGAGIGLVSGMTGTGGGVFLAPAILIMNWVEVRQAAAVSAAYNLLNSIAALAGAYATLDRLAAPLPWWLISVGVGGIIGTAVGSRHLPDHVLRHLLAAVLMVSGLKLILT
ncbi:sulfite exporter TauE/SafE family protein [Telmatospirillum sp.]|uniref:sulfite exporter TauE/SafE family protein n=1 Tax=Telmatospirillum sp. TaxID=2079197 RepID=UPI00284833AE|nr:sulfite exporter TauE/SafE family protein [Telmatospirillum sp.]MDR3438626.1 sulfite exporter TauE/SafE family protein [Telmatospirillum sp.]